MYLCYIQVYVFIIQYLISIVQDIGFKIIEVIGILYGIEISLIIKGGNVGFTYSLREDTFFSFLFSARIFRIFSFVLLSENHFSLYYKFYLKLLQPKCQEALILLGSRLFLTYQLKQQNLMKIGYFYIFFRLFQRYFCNYKC